MAPSSSKPGSSNQKTPGYMTMEGVAGTTESSFMASLFLVLCVLAAWFYMFQKEPRRWPLVGYVPSLIYNCSNFYEGITHLLIQNGGTVTHLKGRPWTNWVVTADPANVEYILKTRFHNFVKGDYFVEVFRDLFGEASVFLQDGDTWKRLRATVSTIFASPGFRRDVIQTTFALVHRRLIPLFQRAAAEGAVLDLENVFHRYSFDSICNFGLGWDPNSLAVDLPDVPFAAAYDRCIMSSMRRFLVPAFYWKTLRFFNLGTERQMAADRKIIDEYAREICALKRECRIRDLLNNSDGKPSGPTGVLPLFLQLEKENHGRVYSDDELRDICVNIIMAGRDTTAPALTWFFWLLQRHPRVEENILLELQGIIKRRSGENDPDPEPFTLDELKEMNYLQAVLSETLRLYPSAPIEISEAANDDELPDGTKVQKGSKVMCLFYSMGRMESIWGPDCREFKPERWLRNGKFVAKSEFVYPVFNGGPRRCAGREVAYLQMKWVTSSIIVRYRVKGVKGEVVVPKFGMMLITRRGMKVTVCPR